jgi:DNA-binding FadR family transcriptional regulator
MKSAQDVEIELKQRVLSGEWDQGIKLPSERRLATEIGTARNTLRKALERLADAGYLARVNGRGAFVKAGEGPGAQRIVFGIGNASPIEVLEARLVIEPGGAALAAARASAVDLDLISQSLRESLAAPDVPSFEKWDARLHFSIMAATRNPVLAEYCRAINTVRNQPKWQQLKQRSVSAERRRRYDDDHTRIVAALLDRDAESAAEAMRRHLKAVLDHMLPFI